jgi:hypothetical protein
MRMRELPFMRDALTEPVNDPRLVQIVRRHLDFHAIAHRQANEPFPHLAGDVCEDDMLVPQFDAEHGPGEDGSNLSFGFDDFFYGHK